jgi:hypothetical protein
MSASPTVGYFADVLSNAYAACLGDGLPCFSEMTLVRKERQFGHSKLWIAWPGQLGCSSIVVRQIGWRHIGHVSST